MTYSLFFQDEFPYYCMIQTLTHEKSVNTNIEEDTHHKKNQKWHQKKHRLIFK